LIEVCGRHEQAIVNLSQVRVCPLEVGEGGELLLPRIVKGPVREQPTRV
jgi:hypothetical protein